MKKRILIIFLLLLTSCSYSREETISAVKTCEDGGMEAKVVVNIFEQVKVNGFTQVSTCQMARHQGLYM